MSRDNSVISATTGPSRSRLTNARAEARATAPLRGVPPGVGGRWGVAAQDG